MMNSAKEISALKMRLIPTAKIEDATTVVPKGATMVGDLEASADLNIRIDGEYNGKIDMQAGGSVHISASAVVASESIVADFIFIEGVIEGNVHARKGLEISSTAKIKGSLRYEKDIDIHPGARVSGQLIGPGDTL